MGKPARILIVDDDQNIIQCTRAILEREGYLVDSAVTGREAIQKTRNAVYDIALLDIRLPDMEGTYLLKFMKNPVPRTRKIMITGYPSMKNAIKSINEKADAYLIKPVKAEKLLNTIKEQLKQKESEREYSEVKVAAFIETRKRQLTNAPT